MLRAETDSLSIGNGPSQLNLEYTDSINHSANSPVLGLAPVGTLMAATAKMLLAKVTYAGDKGLAIIVVHIVVRVADGRYLEIGKISLHEIAITITDLV